MIFTTIFFKKNFNAELLFSDTDSLAYEIKSKNFINNFLNRKICSILVIIRNDDANKNVFGIMKEEMSGAIIVEFVGLKSKMYAIKKFMVEKQILQKE